MGSETRARGSRLGDGLVGPGERNELSLTIGPFYEKIGFTVSSNDSLYRHVLATQRVCGVGDPRCGGICIILGILRHTSSG